MLDAVGQLIEVSADTGFVSGFDRVVTALASLRQRTLARWVQLPDEAWSYPSRCQAWSVHDVVRHVRDVGEIHVARLRGLPTPFPSTEPFDGHDVPNRWLER